jgi:hypothetical protein
MPLPPSVPHAARDLHRLPARVPLQDRRQLHARCASHFRPPGAGSIAGRGSSRSACRPTSPGSAGAPRQAGPNCARPSAQARARWNRRWGQSECPCVAPCAISGAATWRSPSISRRLILTAQAARDRGGSWADGHGPTGGGDSRLTAAPCYLRQAGHPGHQSHPYPSARTLPPICSAIWLPRWPPDATPHG